jgi:hypothetical protein
MTLNSFRGRIIALGVLVILLAMAGWAVLNVGAEGNSYALASPGELYGDVQFGQSFVATYPNLERIDVVMSTYGRRNTRDVVFHLREGPDSQADVASVTFNAGDVRDEAWRSFTFPSLSGSAGKSYYFFFESRESEPDDAVTVMGREGDPYASGQAYIDGQPFPGDMAFRVYYKMTPSQKIDMMLSSLAANKPSLWGSKYAYILLASVYVLLLGALLWQINGHEG